MISVICDGCGEIAQPHEERGMVDKVQYCLGCDEAFQEYVKERDAAHDHLQKTWGNALKTLNRKYLKKLKALPDA